MAHAQKVARHPAIDPEEKVLHAVYGLGASFVRMANASATGLNAARRGSPSPFQADLWAADYDGSEGLAEPLQCTDVLAVTDRRVIFFKNATIIGQPKHIVGVWSHEQILAMLPPNPSNDGTADSSRRCGPGGFFVALQLERFSLPVHR